ncbi:MAG: dihydropteroate synthase [Alphaproteobacteria bacterium]|nr:dihydropteroate synthase [Alphaproteobacteria bacterium]
MPGGLDSGSRACRALARGSALPLAGGPVSFAWLDLILREGASGRRTRRLRVEDGRVSGLPAEAEETFGNLTAARPTFAGYDATRTRVMGIVNVTPDSFSDGGAHFATGAAIACARRLQAEGADLVDIGGESTRPGALPVSREEELARILPVLDGLAGAGLGISIDTRHAACMAAALERGASVVNDVSALTHDPASLDIVAGSGASVVLMHAQGSPADMQRDPRYDDVLLDVYDHLAARIAACRQAGMASGRIAIDPGIGFGKTTEHNLALLSGLALFHGLGCALLLGVSRKGFIGRIGGGQPVERRLGGSLAAGLAGAARGAQWLRVHDVEATVQALAVAGAIARAEP